MTGMVDVLATAVEVHRLCERRGWKFCFIGGIAVQRWGNPRFTVDVDLTLLTGYGSEERFVDAMLEDLEPRRADARQFAVLHRVLLARSKKGVDVDVALGALPFEERSVARASVWSLEGGTELRTCSAEDLIVHKVFAGRDRDWDDVRGVLARKHGKLDWTIIRDELPPLLELKEAPEAMQRLDTIAAEVARRLTDR
jgi:Nucleotidyl transferase AbiEii toxin, Type IV TA system